MLNILRRAWNSLALALSKPINRVAALTLSLYTFLWGCWLASPFWSVFEGTKIFDWLNSVASESFWGGLAISVGAVMTYGVVRGSRNSLTAGAFVGFIYWLLIAIGYFAGDWKNTGGLSAVAMAIFCAAIYLNLRFIHFKETHQE